MSRSYRVICGTPKEHCCGASFMTDQGVTAFGHITHEDAFNCYARYLVRILGYERIGSREFRSPLKEDGTRDPVLVLNKKCRFGGHLRLGKEGRFMPDRDGRHGGSLRGIVIVR